MKGKVKSVLIALLLMISFGIKAQNNISSAQAMFIYNFLRHVNWPEGSTGDVFVIGVFGNSATYDELIVFTKDRKVGSKNIVIKKISTVAEVTQCQLVFVPSTKSSKISEIKNYLGNKPCLIVSENSGTASQGSAIEFKLIDNKLKFHIDEANAKQQQLIISRALLDMSA